MKKVIDYFKNKEWLIGVILLLTLLFLTVGFALYDQTITLNGDVSLKKPGVMHITNISTYSSDLPTNAGSLVLNSDGTIALNYSFTVSKAEKTYAATYIITILNESPYDYLFTGFDIEPSITVSGASSSEAGAVITYEYANVSQSNIVSVGDTIEAGSEVAVAITLNFKVVSEKNNTTIGVSGEAGINSSTEDTGTFLGAIPNSPISLDLTGTDTIRCFNVNVTNTHDSTKTYTYSLTNSNFELVTSSGSSLESFSVGAPSDTDSNANQNNDSLCIRVIDGKLFASTSEKTQVVINPSGLSSFSVGTINMTVDESKELTYEGRPEVQDVTFSATRYDTSTSSLITNVSWSRKDTDGLSIANWYIQLYSSYNDSLVTTFTVDGSASTTNYELSIPASTISTALSNSNNFYIKVYGTDTAGNTGLSYCSQSTDYCVASSATSLKYQFTLTYSGSYASMTNTSNKSATIYLNNEFTSVISTTSDSYTLSGVTVTKDGTELTSGTDYTYSLQSGSSTEADFTILAKTVTSDITVSISTYQSDWECLIRGTKIKTYNGYKNIEDITYQDLLIVYSYELGREVYEYPIKIEKEGKTDVYQKITFSDGSILKTFSGHGIFSKDANKFVSVLNNEDFHIGTTVYKDVEGVLTEVKVTNIEYIYEEETYYNISSTRYLNVIANGFITTDPILSISNIFTFNDDLTWGEDRDEYLKTNDFISYDLLKDYFPKYLYEGIRMKEAKYLINQNIISVEEYVSKFSKMSFVDIPTDSNGNNLWMVTTSLDLENNSRGSTYKEGSTYKLPVHKEIINKEFIGWYNTGDNTYYQDNDELVVNYGMYFEAVYQDKNLFNTNNYLIKK